MVMQSKSETPQVTWIILNAIKELQVGKIKLAQFLKGSKSKNIISINIKQGYGGLMWCDTPTITGFIEQIEVIGLINKKNINQGYYNYPVYFLTEAGKKVLEEKTEIALQKIKHTKPISVGFSEEETLKLIHEGKNIAQIVAERKLTESTIYTHCFRLIVNNLLSSQDIISDETIHKIINATNKLSEPSVKTVKELFPEISYEEIRCVLAEQRGKTK